MFALLTILLAVRIKNVSNESDTEEDQQGGMKTVLVFCISLFDEVTRNTTLVKLFSFSKVTKFNKNRADEFAPRRVVSFS